MPPRADRRARIRSYAAAAALALMMLAPGAASSAELLPRATLAEANRADRFLVDDARRRIIGIGGEGGVPLTVREYDGDTTAMTAKHVYPTLWNQASGLGQPTVVAFDAPLGRIYLVAYRSLADQIAAVDPWLITLDSRHYTVLAERRLSPAILPPALRPMGMRLDGHSLTIVAQPSTPVTKGRAPTLVVAVTIDAGTGAIGWGPTPVRGCQEIISHWSQAEPVVFDARLFLACGTSTVSTTATPGVRTIVEIPLDAPDSPVQHFLPGSYNLGDVYYDDGADRMILVGAAAGSTAQTVWVFDMQRRLLLGQVAAGDNNVFSAGVDTTTGRMYVGVNGSLLITSDRGMEIPQAVAFPMQPSDGSITPIPFNERLIVPVLMADGLHVGVFDDPLPRDAIRPGMPVDPAAFDGLSTEQPQFSAGAGGFGYRIHQIGGAQKLERNLTPVFVPTDPVWQRARNQTSLTDGDREAYFSRIQTAHISEAEAAAAAASSTLDPATRSDYQVLRGENWPFDQAKCVDFGGEPTTRNARSTTVRCDQSKPAVVIETSFEGFPAAAGAADAAALITVGDSGATTTLGRAADGSATATIESWARDVRISDDVRIGYVSSVSTASALGGDRQRRGRARASYVRAFEHVVAGDFRCSTDCDPREVANALGGALGRRFRVELPAEQIVQTPGGIRAHALRDPWEHQQDVALNSQAPTDFEVPALRVSVLNDGVFAHRTIVEFAATSAEATSLRLVPAPPIVPRPPDPPAPRVPDIIERIVKGGGGGGYPTVPTAEPTVLRTFGRGWALLFGGGGSLRAVLLWIVFLAPALLASRRRMLLQRTIGNP